jgi:YD repeat-containing protein
MSSSARVDGMGSQGVGWVAWSIDEHKTWDAAGRLMSTKNRGDIVCLGRDGQGQLGHKGFRPKPEKEKGEASKFC